MSMPEEDLSTLIRQVRQRLESLRRAGIAQIRQPAKSARAADRTAALRPAESGTGPVSEPEPRRRPAAAPSLPPPHPDRVSSGPGSLFGEHGLGGALIPPAERAGQLEALAAQVAVCAHCPHLASTRTQTVFGEGNPNARLMFVGEAPGFDEDRTGRPFVGRAGALLTDIITKGMGLARSEVYIANVLKSRPPNNRTPLPDEVAHCLPYLERQIEIVRPEYLCLLGKTAATALLKTTLAMGMLRSRWHMYRGIPTIVTYHPSYLLRNPPAKRDVWEDLQMLMAAMGITPPARRGGENGPP